MGDDKMSAILELRGLTKAFLNTGSKDKTEVLNNLNLSVEPSEFLCILGPSGCGKTTMLRCVAGFETYEGDVLVNGKLETGPGTDRIMIFQDFNQLFPWKTVEKNIQYGLKLQGIKDKTELKKISDAALKKVKLDGYQNFYPYQLSGGMKQRVAIAKAFAHVIDVNGPARAYGVTGGKQHGGIVRPCACRLVVSAESRHIRADKRVARKELKGDAQGIAYGSSIYHRSQLGAAMCGHAICHEGLVCYTRFRLR